MIRALFHKSRDGFLRVEISGHAGLADYGQDVLCASVTSAVQLTANGITEVLGTLARVVAAENRIVIDLDGHSSQDAMRFLQALHLHLEILAEQYENHLKLTVLEV